SSAFLLHRPRRSLRGRWLARERQRASAKAASDYALRKRWSSPAGCVCTGLLCKSVRRLVTALREHCPTRFPRLSTSISARLHADVDDRALLDLDHRCLPPG